MSPSKRSQSPTPSRADRQAVSKFDLRFFQFAHPLDAEAETQVDAVDAQQAKDKAEKGARTAENVRYGQNISEGGMGGMTTEGQGGVNQGMRCLS